MSRRGFALLAVMWIVVALAALVAAAVEKARADNSASGDDIVLMRGRWAAEGCLAVARQRIEDSLAAGRGLRAVDVEPIEFANGVRCDVALADPGTMPPDSLGWSDGRLNVNAAPESLLAVLPGLGAEALRAIEESREWRRPFADIGDLAARLSPSGRGALFDRYSELLPRVTFAPASLVLRATGWRDGSHATAHVDELIVSGGSRAAVVRRRMY